MSRLHFRFEQSDALPRLAWCATVRAGEATVEVHHGAWVEVGGDWFAEGAWDGDFGGGDLSGAVLMGSGGRLTAGAVRFAAPSHTLERLHLFRGDDVLFVSNSLAFVLARAGDSLDPAYSGYKRDLASVIHGLRRCVRTIPTLRGHRVELCYHADVTVDRTLAVREIPKPAVTEFTTFAAYTGFLAATVAAIHRNATDARRQRVYRPLATISSGYDSPVAAVFAADVGCVDALTFRDSRYHKHAARVLPDSGADIAAVLGMRVHEYGRGDYLKLAGFPEAEFLASGADGADVTMAPWQDVLPQRLLFTGFHGDKVWDRNNRKVSPHIVRGDPSGSSLAEFRLRVGFIHLPLPFIGCTSHPSIHRLSSASEMRPWTLGTSYDRPIARRIVEASGIERAAFGQRKKAVTAPLALVELGGVMTEASLADFTAFYRRHRSRAARLVNAVWLAACGIYTRGALGANAVLGRSGVPLRAPIFIPRPLRYRQGSESLLNHWGVELTKPRYAVALRATEDAPPRPAVTRERATVAGA